MSSRKCAVPSCSYKQGKTDEKRSMFRCPKNELKAQQWSEAIPGITTLGPNQHVCEKHFDENMISRYFDATSGPRTRLATNAVPTIFNLQLQVTDLRQTQQQTHSGNRHSAPLYFSNFGAINSYDSPTSVLNNSLGSLQLSNITIYNKNNQVTRPITDTSLTDTIRDLSASEQILMKIKREEFSDEPSVKSEDSEEYDENMKEEMDYEMKELSAYDELKNNFDYYATLIPESWNVARLSIGSDEVFTFSKECTINENSLLVVMYEKNVVLNKNGNVHYSVHGKMITAEDTELPNIIDDIKSLLDIITKFSNMTICQGITTREFEVDKDYIVFKDDLGFCRHVNCVLVTDAEQCDFCYKYSQYLSDLTANNTSVLSGPMTAYNNHFF